MIEPKMLIYFSLASSFEFATEMAEKSFSIKWKWTMEISSIVWEVMLGTCFKVILVIVGVAIIEKPPAYRTFETFFEMAIEVEAKGR